MLERLRFQEIQKAIFRVKDDIVLNGKKFKKGQPFLVVDNATMSKFVVHMNSKSATDRGYIGGTDIIKGITFDLIEGHVLLNVFGSVFGNTKKQAIAPRTEMINVSLVDDDRIELPVTPIDGTLLIYKNTIDGTSMLLSDSQYTLEDNVITLITKFTGELLITYKENIEAMTQTGVYQIGQNMVLELELQCKALDIISGDQHEILMRFANVNTGVNFNILFNNSGDVSFSTIHCEVMPESAAQTGINKPLFEIDVL